MALKVRAWSLQEFASPTSAMESSGKAHWDDAAGDKRQITFKGGFIIRRINDANRQVATHTVPISLGRNGKLAFE